VAHGDTKIQHVDEWTASDGEFTWHPKGGGGTSHIEVMDFFDGLDEKIDLLICFTDLQTVFRPQEPDYPVLWISTDDLPIPYGTKLVLPKIGEYDW